MFEGVDHERNSERVDLEAPREANPWNLVPETGADGDAFASLGATTRKNRLSALGLHPRTETVGLGPATAVRLKCTFRHETGALLLENDCNEQTVSIRE